MDYKNGQNLRKSLNADVLQIFAFAVHIVSHNVEDKPKWTGKSSHNVEDKSKWRHLLILCLLGAMMLIAESQATF